MKEGARLQAVQILLDQILTSTAPADNVITGYFRQCRYMGSSDRRMISQSTYQILRRYEELVWYLQGASSAPSVTGRLLVLAYAHKMLGLSIPQIQELCQGEKFTLEPLSTLEHLLLKEMARLTPESMPLAVRLNIPDWVMPRLQATFGTDLEDAVQALNQPAPFDLRVNTLKTTREAVLQNLRKDRFEAIPTPWSPVGIRLGERRPLSGHTLWKQGHIEVQDEGSQILALLSDAQPGMAVLDFCAGAGGKTLAMAATMCNQGRIVATDVATWRLSRSRERFRRAGANNVEVRVLEEGTLKWLKRQSGRFDRVLVDAPCSGSGTWRRNPDLKRHFTEQDLKELVQKQQEILLRAAPLVKPGGRLIYATCSLFAEENGDQIKIFLEASPHFGLIPISDIWPSVLRTPFPFEDKANHTLQLAPHTHQVDGFFMAVMERTKK